MSTELYNKLNIPKHLKDRQDIKALFQRYSGLFSFDGAFGATNILEHEIVMKLGV